MTTTAKITYDGRLYLVSPIGCTGHWSFTAYGETILHVSDMDLINEFGEDDAAWGQYIDDVYLSLDLIRYNAESGEYEETRHYRTQMVGLGHPDYYVQH